MAKLSLFDSLKSQLLGGAVGLLAVTVTVISFVLIESEKRFLTDEIEKSVILQGRNIALGSEKAFLRDDPEYELYPLVTRIAERNDNITSVTITDSAGIMLGGMELQNLSQKMELDLKGFTSKSSAYVEADETLYENGEAFLLRAPVRSLGRVIGYVHLVYSKKGLRQSVGRAVTMTIVCGLGAFALAIVASLHLFRRISRPMEGLMVGVDTFGQGKLETRIQLTGSREFRVLAGSFNEMAASIAEAQEQLVEKRVTDRELAIARDIQKTLIPSDVIDPVGYSVSVHYKSARQVGGDYIDVIPIDSRRLALVVADVSGKGVPGLVVTGMLKIMVHELVRKAAAPKEIVRQLNLAIARHLRKNMFVTMFVGVLDVDLDELTYSCAGHVPTVVYRRDADRCELVKLKVPPLGFLPDEEFVSKLVENRIRLAKGDLILQYTDGLTECQNGGGEMFGYDRLLEVCRKHGFGGPHELVEALVREEELFRAGNTQRDDVSLLCVGSTVASREPLGVAEGDEACRSS